MRKPRLVSGGLAGMVLGLMLAIILQQLGIWPLDRLTVFLLPALLGLLGVLIGGWRREKTRALIWILLPLLALAIWGGIGLGSINESGEINGGCTATAISAVDTTTVTNSTKRNPFVIDPDGPLEWTGHSPIVFMDYDWEIWADIGDIRVPVDSDHEDNTTGTTDNTGNTGSIKEYADAHGIKNVENIRGIFKVGGFAATCDGFGFIKISSDPFETTIAKLALGIAVLMVLLLIWILTRAASDADEFGQSAIESTTTDPEEPAE